ncbi:OmpA family protein [Thermodesulfovibrionales bacterium]|nr:OmpA family protein [Thermodesulfovibrionales bacterium]
MDNSGKTIIIKRIKKGHDEAHGGSWKIAFADFVLAMMAFFLLMWLLAMVSEERRIMLEEYFKQFSIFKEAGHMFEEKEPGVIQAIEILPTRPAKTERELFALALEEKLKEAITLKLAHMKDQVIVDIVEKGVRIQLVDLEGEPMFELGRAELNPSAKKALAMISDYIRDIPNMLVIEGHTDAKPFVAGQITNWELSVMRSSAVRMELGRHGIGIERIAKITGHAATKPLIEDDPFDPRNRRVSITILIEAT